MHSGLGWAQGPTQHHTFTRSSLYQALSWALGRDGKEIRPTGGGGEYEMTQ